MLDIKIELYVGRKVDFMSEVKLADNGDGEGAFISEWNITEKIEPTSAQLDALGDAATKVDYNNKIMVQRRNDYGTPEEQLEMIYLDGINKTLTWLAHITAINKLYPLK